MANTSGSYLQRKLDRIRRGGTPPWWTMAQVLVGGVFALVFAWNLMAGTDQPPAAAPTPAAPQTRTPVSPDATPDSTPADPVSTPTAGEVMVDTAGGSRRAVPAAAYEAAKAAFAGTYDPAAAAAVPMAEGETFTPPAEAHPQAVIGTITLSVATEDAMTFVALGDPDGKGPQAGTYLTYTVIADGDGWAVTTQL